MLKRLILELLVRFTNGKLIFLYDHDDEKTLTIAYPTGVGEYTAERHWPFKIRTVTLLSDGTVSNGAYVRRWRDA